jgi:hypothetical protein
MQRWLFFIFCGFAISGLKAQPIDVFKTEVSIWMAGPQSYPTQQNVKARAVVSFKSNTSGSEFTLDVGPNEVSAVKLKEGREKNNLTYRLEGAKLTVQLPLEISKRYEVVVEYMLPMGSEAVQRFIQQSEDMLVLNPFNTRQGAELGVAGTFYPAVAGDACWLLLNVTLLNKKSIGFDGVVEFETHNGEGFKSIYGRSHQPLNPEAFYLVIGEFKEFEAEDLEEEFELSAIELRKIKFYNAKQDMQGALQYLSIQSEAITDSQLAYVDSLSQLPQPGFFISGLEHELGINSQDLKRIKALLLFQNNNDTGRASNKLYEVVVQKKGSSWEELMMDNKWRNRQQLPQEQVQIVLAYRLNRWKSSNPELFKNYSEIEIDTTLIGPMLQTFQFPVVEINYRYVAKDTALYIGYLQDTSISRSYPLPVEVKFTTSEGTFSQYKKLMDVAGNLRITTAKIPNVAYVNFGNYFPGRVNEKKPDTYLLYQLGEAQTAAGRKEALTGLFKTQNPNLFSTALGIAMRDTDAEVRLLALQNAINLDVSAQQKLKGSIEILTEDASSQIRKLANELADKYYGNK